MEKALDPTRSREFCLGLIEAAPDALLVTDGAGRIVIANVAAEKMFGYPRAGLVDQPIEKLVPRRFRAAHARQRAAYAAAPLVRPMGIGRELVAQRRDGTELPVEIALSPLETELGPLTIAIVRDVSERRRTEEKLRYLSGHDTLTGLYNRHMFEEQESRLARGRQFPVSILVFDLDGLKEINDLRGHAAGDEMLQRAGAVLAQAFRGDDTVARIGGDEFAALLPSTDREAAALAVDRVKRIVGEHNRTAPEPALSLSIGASTAEPGRSLGQCLREADVAMYRHKSFRRGRVR